MKILILGATGMAGHTIAVYLTKKKHDVTTFTRTPFCLCTNNIVGDAFDLKRLGEVIHAEKYDAIINCIGILNDNAEKNKYNAVFLNSLLPHYLAKELADLDTRLIHISTDCIFSGKTGKYEESSVADGFTFYDRTKAIGEIVDNKNLTFRSSIIGPDMNEKGIGLFNWFMQQNDTINGYAKAIWTGITTLTLAKAIESAIQQNLTGLYHLVNNSTINKYELLKLFNYYFKDNNTIINKQENIMVDKSLINNRKDFNFVVPSYEEMISEMRSWICEHKELYPHYNIKKKEEL